MTKYPDLKTAWERLQAEVENHELSDTPEWRRLKRVSLSHLMNSPSMSEEQTREAEAACKRLSGADWSSPELVTDVDLLPNGVVSRRVPPGMVYGLPAEKQELHEKSELVRYGSFRDLTRAGALGVGDGGTILCASPCPITGGRS